MLPIYDINIPSIPKYLTLIFILTIDILFIEVLQKLLCLLYDFISSILFVLSTKIIKSNATKQYEGSTSPEVEF